ncbi:hypothetical protein STENM223S_04261 [Streptomyces tendae]
MTERASCGCGGRNGEAEDRTRTRRASPDPWAPHPSRRPRRHRDPGSPAADPADVAGAGARRCGRARTPCARTAPRCRVTEEVAVRRGRGGADPYAAGGAARTCCGRPARAGSPTPAHRCPRGRSWCARAMHAPPRDPLHALPAGGYTLASGERLGAPDRGGRRRPLPRRADPAPPGPRRRHARRRRRTGLARHRRARRHRGLLRHPVDAPAAARPARLHGPRQAQPVPVRARRRPVPAGPLERAVPGRAARRVPRAGRAGARATTSPSAGPSRPDRRCASPPTTTCAR